MNLHTTRDRLLGFLMLGISFWLAVPEVVEAIRWTRGEMMKIRKGDSMNNRRWSARSLSNMEGIHPHLRAVLEDALQSSPVDFVVIEGLRTHERQRQLMADGKSKTLNSRHLTGDAIDLMPIDPATGRGSFDWPLYHQLAPAVKSSAEKLGVSLKWGGDWTTFPDGPHFELSWQDYPVDSPRMPLRSTKLAVTKLDFIFNRK